MAQAPENKAIQRLQKELKKLKEQPLAFAEAAPSNDDLLLWVAKIQGPKNSPYENGVFKIQIQFSPQYPMKPPELTFLTKIYHPSVQDKDGKVCQEIIGKNWAPVLNMFYILETLQQMLVDPTTDSPLEPEIAELLAKDKKKFEKTAKEWTKKYAK